MPSPACARWNAAATAPLKCAPDVQQAQNAALQQRLGGSVWSQCRSWYRMEDGKVIAIFPGFVREYVQAVRQPRFGDYVLEPEAAPARLPPA